MDTPKGEDEKSSAPAAANASAGKSGGGMGAWLPLIIAVVVMPLVAYAMTQFILLPKLKNGLSGANPAAAAPAEGESGHGGGEKSGGHNAKPAEGGSAHGSPSEGGTGGRQIAVMNKLLVNVSGTMASRYLLTSFTLVGKGADFGTKVKNNEAQLKDMACGILSTKTIADLEKPGARNLIRSELISGLNNILGGNAVQEIYFTEFAIQ